MEKLYLNIAQLKTIDTNNISSNLYKTLSNENPSFLGYDLTKPVPNKLIVNTGISIISWWILLALLVKVIAKHKNNKLKK